MRQNAILVADDEEMFRLTTVDLLERQGFEAVGVASGKEAIERVQAGAFSLVLCDINMPGNTELQLVKELHAVTPQLPIILITGYPSVSTAAAAVQLGVEAYLTKPVDPERIIRLIDQTLMRSRARDQIEQSERRVREWHLALQNMLGEPWVDSAHPSNRYLNAFVTLTLENIRGVVNDLKHAMDTIASEGMEPAKEEALGDALPIRIVKALEETIVTIEDTKRQFKSKELAALRRRLEMMLVTSPASKQVPAGTTSTRKPPSD